MDKYDRLQALMLGIKKRYCGDNAAELARKLGKDASYVNRVFSPRGKKGAKGIGPDLMERTSEVFALPRGFWEMTPAEAFGIDSAQDAQDGPTLAEAIRAIATLMRDVSPRKRELVALSLSELARHPELALEITEDLQGLLKVVPPPAPEVLQTVLSEEQIEIPNSVRPHGENLRLSTERKAKGHP